MARRPSPKGALKMAFGAAVIAVTLSVWSYVVEQSNSASDSFVASGTIEVDEVSITAEAGGRVTSVSADEGSSVKEGDVLAAIDGALAEAQLRQARAAVDIARANLAVIQRGAREEEIRQAEAALAQAVAQRDAAKKSWENSSEMLQNPQDLNAKINAAYPQVKAAQAKLDALLAGPSKEQIAEAEAALHAAQNQLYSVQASADAQLGSGRAIFTREMKEAQAGAAYEQVKIAEARLSQLKAPPSEEAVRQARAAVEQAEANLSDLLDIREKPLMLMGQVDAARGQYEAAESAVNAAEARLDAINAGATLEQVEVARAQVQHAEAAVGVVEAQLQKLTLRSPLNGIVTRRFVRVGEVVSPGMLVSTLADLTVVKLVVYVPETRVGKVSLGQEAETTVDSFPGRTFVGKVVYISSKAEFTPRNIQSQRERANTVFAVRIEIPNQDLMLKPGMPADARFRS